MPYISGSGTPAPIGTDAFAPPTQLKGLVDAEADFNYFTKVDVDGDRATIATPQLREGLFCYVKATDLLWKYTSAGWKQAIPTLHSRKVSRVANQSMSSTGSLSILQIDTTSGLPNVGSITYAGSPDYALVAPVNGVYSIGVILNYASNASGNRLSGYSINGLAGTQVVLDSRGGLSVTGGQFVNSSEPAVTLTAGDKIALIGAQSSGGNLNVTGTITLSLVAAT